MVRGHLLRGDSKKGPGEQGEGGHLTPRVTEMLMQGGGAPCRTTLRAYGVRLRDRRLRRMSLPAIERRMLGGDCTEGTLSRQSQPEGGGWVVLDGG